jgi:hypothetical protein
MTWYLLLVPLAVLVILPLFGFIGCSFCPSSESDGYYPDLIKDEPNLVAYWRLGEPSTTPVPSSGGAAVDQQAMFNGDYLLLVPRAADIQRHSPTTIGTISLGVTPGLLIDTKLGPTQSQDSCILADGGYVRVPANDALNPPVFTFECWIDLTGFDQEPEGNYYCLVESTGPANEADPRSIGFGLYLGPQFPNAPTGAYFWQVWMGDGTQFRQVAVGSQPVDAAQSRLTYLALTFAGNNSSVHDDQGNDLNFNLALYLYRPDTQQEISVPSLQALHGTTNNFTPNTVANGGGGDFFIGAGSNLFPDAAPWSFVQVASSPPQAVPVHTVTATYPGTQAAGNFNIVVVGWRGQNALVQSVTDSAGNSYTLATGPVTGTLLRQYIYFAANIKGGANTVTVTWTPANNATTPDVRILEYAGVVPEGSLDQPENSLDPMAQASGTSATSQCGPVTITSANELIFAANTTSGAAGAPSAGSGYTGRIITSNENIAEDQLASAIGSYSATAPLTTSGNWVMQMATFRAGPFQRLYPFKGKIQEVALYNADLSTSTIGSCAVSGVLSLQAQLANHEQAGGNL